MDSKNTTLNKHVLVDLAAWTLASVMCILWRLVADKSTIWAYVGLFVAMAAVWCLLGWTYRLYRSYKDTWLWQAVGSLALVAGTEVLLTYFLVPLLPTEFSLQVCYWMIGVVSGLALLEIVVAHYWKYATNMTVPVMTVEQRENAQVSRQEAIRSEASRQTVMQSVLSVASEEDYKLLHERADLDSNLTKVVCNRDRFGFLQIPDYQYKTLVDLTLLNDAKGINKRFCIVNQKLPDNGRYVCCYRPQEYIKKKILDKYPKGLNWIFYSCYFFWKRVIPRLVLTSRLYYDATNGRKRMLSKTEVLGRLYYCGFEVEDVVPMGHIEYVFARRRQQPYPQEQMKVYGPLIKLRRVGKDRKDVFIFKMRTMHPYSEYIQKYVFDQRGGMNIADKSDDDWRITTWGRFMRRYWLDELPMLLNWLKGDVKLVGVRPLSHTMFDTYPPELQEQRTQSKPGLIPPFYIDHPKTFDELFASEKKYLDAYEKHPLWTDCRYFCMTINSILFKRMHSA